jgi:predicted signal transduction protein with EAL and GGDEF domain
MRSRPAALLLTGVAVIPFTIFFVSTGRPVFIAIALDMLLVSAAMIYVLSAYPRDFANMMPGLWIPAFHSNYSSVETSRGRTGNSTPS